MVRAQQPMIDGATLWICASCRTQVSRHSSRMLLNNIVRNSSTASRKTKLPTSPARTRFAPSPTGNLHLGSLRTALFSYLIAKRTGGQFILRIEDTDQKRTVAGAEERLYEDLRWAGLLWNEGPVVGGPHGPYRQSERRDLYHEHITQLLEGGSAYRCFCSAERIDGLNRMRHERGLPLGYDRKCADIPKQEAADRAQKSEAHVVRFRVPKEYPKFDDLVYGKTGHGANKTKKMQVNQPIFDDPILFKSDAHPTYHFANVVDDKLMRITHVIRGSEWMASTPLHIALYDAFGWHPPTYAHVPLLVDRNHQKLSKRNFDTDIASYRDANYLPEALINFTALLGWSHQEQSDVVDLKQLEAMFDLKFTKGNTIVAFDKLTYLQEQHARRMIELDGEELEQMIRDVAVVLLEKFGARPISEFIGTRQLRNVIASMLRTESIPYRSPNDFAQQVSNFFENIETRPKLEIRAMSDLRLLRIAAATLCLTPIENWSKSVHRANISQLELDMDSGDANPTKQGKKELYHYLRWALLGGAHGPSIPEIMEILGKEICEMRIREAALVTKEMENMASKPEVLYSPSKVFG